MTHLTDIWLMAIFFQLLFIGWRIRIACDHLLAIRNKR